MKSVCEPFSLGEVFGSKTTGFARLVLSLCGCRHPCSCFNFVIYPRFDSDLKVASLSLTVRIMILHSECAQELD